MLESKKTKKNKKTKQKTKNKQTNKQLNMQATMIPHIIDALGTVPQRIGKGIGMVGNKSKNREHLDFCIIEMGKNTEKSPGDLRRLILSDFRESPTAKRKRTCRMAFAV